MSVELIRFWKSLLLRRSSSSLILSSWLTVLELLVDRLQLLLARLQLLGGRAQFLVGRLLLFARRLGFLDLRFVLLDRRPQLRLDPGQLLFELLGDRRGRRVQRPHPVWHVAAVVIEKSTRKKPRAGSSSRSSGRTTMSTRRLAPSSCTGTFLTSTLTRWVALW